MKKIFSLCVAAIAAITMTAQDIAVNIKIVAQSGGESTLLLASGTGVSSADNATLVAPLANSDNVAIYVPEGAERYSIYATDGEFVNLPLAFISDRMPASVQNYTLHFEDVLGGTGTGSLKIKDLVTGTEQTILDGGSYGPFDATVASGFAAGTNNVIANRFVINYDEATYSVVEVTTNANGLATFSFDQNVQPVEAFKIYKGAVSGENLNLTQVNDVKAGEGVIVYGAANTTYHFNAGTGTSVFDGNELIAASAWEHPHAGFDTYVLSGNALYLYEGDLFPANKAFLKIAQSGSGAPRRISLRFDQATAIDNVAAENVKAEKVVENGQIFIRRGNEVYNLQGQIVK